MDKLGKSNKSKIAKRVIEILEFFDDNHASLKVGDIVRRHGRPHSTTSELLTSLVEMGLLYKDPRTRAYSPTPRVAAFGFAAQPEIIRNGSLFAATERLASETGYAMALFGMIGIQAQVFHASKAYTPECGRLWKGDARPLGATTVGLLLLSTFGAEHVSRVLRRLNSEAEPEAMFDVIEVGAKVAAIRQQGFASGPCGFELSGQLTAVLLPRTISERPLALGVIHGAKSQGHCRELAKRLETTIAECDVAASWPTTRPIARMPQASGIATGSAGMLRSQADERSHKREAANEENAHCRYHRGLHETRASRPKRR